jgi:hypothetical protein
MDFQRISNKALSSRIRGLTQTAEKVRQYFWNVLFNCVANSFEHNDVSWVNRGLEMAKAVGKYRATLAILRQVVPFPVKDGVFHGKRKAKMYQQLESKFETVLLALIDAQKQADSKPVSKKDWEYETARENFIKACAKHNVDLDDVVVDIADYVADQKAA